MRQTLMPNGDVVFRSKKDIPEGGLLGYTQNKKEPCLFHPSPGPCQYRVATFCELPCGKIRTGWACAYLKTEVNLLQCLDCTIGK